MDAIEPKISSQAEAAGFNLKLCATAGARRSVIEVDADAFMQIIINLVDNAIKFSASAQKKQIDIDIGLVRADTLRVGVRDYGPGVPGDQMKKIFKLFYRAKNELTRDTVGTGIGLALVHQLALAMNGRVDVVNREPGVEFTVDFDLCQNGGG
jgi:signal transduction histidine kinase